MYRAAPAGARPPLVEQPFAATPLSRAEADAARELLVADWRTRLRDERAAELASGKITLGEHAMPIFYETFGEAPASGRSLFISMHGGGNAPAAVNDRQWRNQQRLYEPDEGIYVAPRAPTDTWNLWHEAHIDALFDRLIEDMVVCEDVDPNRVYLMGYSAGGDGVYQLAPRMADRFAAVAMMAGHPNETSPLGLRNLPFALHVGELDDGYDRNKVAAEWQVKLAELHRADPHGYVHHVEIHSGKRHWMDREDASAVPWMSQFTREPWPRRIVWKQDDVTHTRFYWLAVAADDARAGAEVRADIAGQEVTVNAPDVPTITVRMSDELVDLDQPVTIRAGGKERFRGQIPRTIAVIAKSLDERGDPAAIYAGECTVSLTK
jgi:poly(3-hydroxybutyrate) depolymerase